MRTPMPTIYRKEENTMKPLGTTGMEVRSGARMDDCLLTIERRDAQFAELIETIWACERQWTIDDHVDAAIKYGRQ
jgi:hypothetical protein